MFNIKGLRKEDLAFVAKELGQNVEEDHKVVDLKVLIEKSSQYCTDKDFVKEFLISTVNDRLDREREEKIKKEHEHNQERERMKNEQEAALELERMKLELAKTQLEITRLQAGNRSSDTGVGEQSATNSLESVIRSVKTLTLAVPTKAETWNLFFASLEKAFEIKKVADEIKVEILFNLLGEKAAHLMVYLNAEEMTDYQKVKNLILKEFQPTPEACLESFISAKRERGENHMQFASRIRANWNFYCELRKVNDFETLNELIVSDRLLNALDPETRSYIRIKQLDSWLRPKQIAELSDNLFTSKGRTFSELYDKPVKFRNQNEINNLGGKYVPPPMRNNYNNYYDRNTGLKECKLCKNVVHLRFCPNKDKNKTGVSQNQTKKELSKYKQEDKLVARVKTDYFDSDAVETQPLQYTYITLEGKEIKTLIDSAAEIPILNSNVIPSSLKNDDCSKIQLISAFGETVTARLHTFSIALKSGNFNHLTNMVDVLFAVTDKLVVPCIITPAVFKILQTADCEGEGGNSHVIDTWYGNEKRRKNVSLEESRRGGKDDSELLAVFPGCSEQGELFTQSDSPLENKDLMISCVRTDDTKAQNVGQCSDASTFKEQQKNCETLQESFRDAKRGKNGYFILDDLLYHKEKVSGDIVTQLEVPKVRRGQILKLAHESVFANHLGMKKTKERIRYSFHWPKMGKDINEYCRACPDCQLRGRERARDQIPIVPIPRPDFPFDQVNIDIIGPIEPPSMRKHKYVLCLIDQHSRWPEAVPLKTITAKATCDALLEIFMRTGIPRIISSDQATNFVSKLTQEFHARLGTAPRFATPGHPQSSGLVERYNQVLKHMLHHIIRSDPKNWDKYIPYLLFAYREVPNSTTGVSPFKLMYGREARGPLSVLKSSWAGEIPLPINIGKSAVEYLQELKINLEKAAEQASLIAEVKQGAYARYANRRAVYKEFQSGDQVYLLIPDSNNKLYARWTGPAEIVDRYKPDSYKVKLVDGTIRNVHVNKIKRFIPRVQVVAVIFENEEELGEVLSTPSIRDTPSTTEKCSTTEKLKTLT